MSDIRAVRLTEENLNTAIFLQYLHENGVDLQKKLLELSSEPAESLTQFLPNSFLLSKKVEEEELRRLNINGANGYVSTNGIIVSPETNTRLMKKPNISDFDSIVSAFYSDDLLCSIILNKNVFMGFCRDKTSESKRLYRIYEMLAQSICGMPDKIVTMSHDTFQEKNKELCLVKVLGKSKRRF